MNSSAIAATAPRKADGDRTIRGGVELRTDALGYGVRSLPIASGEG
ncbi:hypothetical protein [Nocardia nepalensis]